MIKIPFVLKMSKGERDFSFTQREPTLFLGLSVLIDPYLKFLEVVIPSKAGVVGARSESSGFTCLPPMREMRLLAAGLINVRNGAI